MRAIYYFILVVIASTFATIGFLQDGWAFSSNLFAESAGMFISIAVGFLLVDRIIEKEARRKWDRVSKHTLRSIRHYLGDIHFVCMTHFESNVRQSDSNNTPIDFRQYAEYLERNAEELGRKYNNRHIEIGPHIMGDMQSIPLPDGGTRYIARTSEHASYMNKQWLDEQSSISIYREMRPVFERFRDVITPRVVDFGYEPDLVAALVAVESADTDWVSNLNLIEDDWGLPESFAWGTAAAALYACADLEDEVERIESRASSDRRIPLDSLVRLGRQRRQINE